TPDNTGGSTASSTHTYDVAQNLTANGFTAPSGKRFSGWAETSGGAVKYTDRQSVINLTTTNAATINLYAVWEMQVYTVVFNANCGTGETYTATIGVGEQYKLPSSIFTNSTHKIFAWNTEADGEGDEYFVDQEIINLASSGEKITLFAQWTYTATFRFTIPFSASNEVGVLITNDSELSFKVDERLGSIPCFKSNSTGGVPTYTEINSCNPGSKLISTTLADTGLYYEEVYYTASTTPDIYEIPKEVQPGFFIFLFAAYCGGDNCPCFSQYSATAPLTCSLVINSYYGEPSILKYEMPKYNVLFECKADYNNYGPLVCFPAYTLISSEYGYKNIQDVQIGDMVWTYNEVSGKFELKRVYFTRVVETTTEVIHIGFGDTTLTATHNHEFLTQNRGWVSAKELSCDDIIIANGEYLQITSYESEIVKDFYYNFSVEDNHNYLVSNKNIVVDDFYCQQQRWGLVE
ncbi:MAG: InlB B-repeat-containing protein, partial [Clostridia bacterium]|nr:InlB B-repeat-containing protein [Clostridia bacterium]